MKNQKQKNIITLSVADAWASFEREADSLAEIAKKDSNKRKQVNKCRFVQYLLDSLPSNVMITTEGCWKDGIIREGQLSNAGSVIECIVKYHLKHTDSVCKAWTDDEADAMQGCMAWEVKYSVNCKFKSTPAKEALTLHVNPDGISLIKKADVMSIADSKGKLPWYGIYGNRNHPWLQRLTEAMGLEEGWEE
jgi:hypothetical protein